MALPLHPKLELTYFEHRHGIRVIAATSHTWKATT